jgi:hypothetical protein
MICAGSVAMSEGQDNKSTVFALEGTAAHEFNEFIISNGYDPLDWQGGAVDLQPSEGQPAFLKEGHPYLIDRERFFEIDSEMVEGCQLTIDTIEKYYSRVDGDELMLETRLDMSWIHPKLFGTGDILIYKRRTKTLIVLDYKYGSGHVVEVEDNEQVLTYGVGAAKLFEIEGVDKVVCVIIQPRAFHREGPVRTIEIEALDLTVFEGQLIERAAATDDPDAPLIAGDHCKFCPAAHCCPTLRLYVLETAGVRPAEEITEADMPKPTQMTPAELGRVVREAHIIEGWVRRVLQHAHSEAMEGRVPDGTKIVDKRAYRKFTATEDEIVALLDLEGFSEDDYMKDPKLLSLTQLEKSIGKKKFVEIFGDKDDPERLWKKESSGFVLAPIEDGREQAKLSTGGSFGAVEDDD